MMRPAVLSLLACALLAPSAPAFYSHLSPEQVREAYFIGRQTEQADALLSRYSQEPRSGLANELDLQKVTVLTPYAQIVTASRLDMTNENSVDADQQYASRPLPLIIRVWFYFPSGQTTSFERFDHAVRADSITVSQRGALRPQRTQYTALYSSGKGHWPVGIEVEMSFDAAQFGSEPVIIVVASPDGRHADVAFDLGALK